MIIKLLKIIGLWIGLLMIQVVVVLLHTPDMIGFMIAILMAVILVPITENIWRGNNLNKQ